MSNIKTVKLTNAPMIATLTSSQEGLKLTCSNGLNVMVPLECSGSPYTANRDWMVHLTKTLDGGTTVVKVVMECRIPGEEGCWNWYISDFGSLVWNSEMAATGDWYKPRS